MSVTLAPIADAAVLAAASAVTALAAMLLRHLPLIWTALRVYMDGNDATRVRYAIANRAQVAMQAIDGGQPQDRAVDEMIDYLRDSLPRALERLGTTNETLRTMCEAELARLMAGRG